MFSSDWASCALLGIAAVVTPLTCLAAQPDLDPDALNILKATSGAITGANAFSFRVRVSHDRPATNNQLVTYFKEEAVTVSRPDKLRIDVDGEHHDAQSFFDGKTATLFDPKTKLYALHSAPGTIDAMLKVLEKQGVSFPINNLLESNPYDSLAEGLQTAYVVGRVEIKQQDLYSPCIYGSFSGLPTLGGAGR